MAWSTTTPTNSDLRAEGAARIREIKTDMQGALRGQATEGLEAMFPGASAASPIFRYRGLKGTTAARPTAGQYGLYFDTTRNALQRDNGTSWEDILTLIPSGSVMAFFQAAAPTGWTQVTTQNAKALRCVTGTGGGSGGSADPASTITLAHTHTVASHTHSISSQAGHSLNDHGLSTGGANAANQAPGGTNTVASTTSAAHDHGGATGAATPATDSQLSNVSLAYIDVVIASKD